MSVKPWDLLDPSLRASDAVADERLATCRACDRLIQLTTTCRECGCFMVGKTKLAPAECPLGKWTREER